MNEYIATHVAVDTMEIIPQFLQTSYPLRVEHLIRFLSPIISRRRRLGDTTIDCQEKFLTKSFKRFSVLILANRRLKKSTSFVCIFPLVENELQCNPVPKTSKTSISLLQSPLYIAAILSQVVTKDARDLEDPRTASGSRCQSRSFVCPSCVYGHAAFRAMDFFLAGDRTTRHGEDCSGLVSSLKERMSRRNLISQSARPGVDSLSRFLNV